MRIALNLIGYAPGCGGVETYVTNLLAALQEIDRENQYLVLCDEIAAGSLRLSAGNFTLMVYAHQKYSVRWIVRGVVQRICGFDILARELGSLPVDVMHHPLTVLNPPGLSCPSVLTFHDMQQEYFPEFFAADELARRKKSYLSSVLEARAVIAISEHAGACIVEKYRADPRKIHSVHSGCGDEFQLRDPATLAATAAKYAIDGPFIFYPAAAWPHKNHLRLLEAVRILIESGSFDGILLLAGARQSAHGELIEAVARLGLTSRVRWLGYLPKEDLPQLYNLARIMVFPSLFEGFGLPVVEAMASGCPVVCSRSTSLPEVGGDAVIYFDPWSKEDIAEKISRVWNDPALWHELKLRGMAQSAKFCWRETAKKTLQVYREVFEAAEA
jgi:glycosyltransferase involved in cell wall biosynthesis